MTANLNIKLDAELSKKISGGPEFLTQVASLSGGKEVRNISQIYAKHRYFIDLSELGEREINRLKNLFLNCYGKAKTFVMRDWGDFVGNMETQGVGDGVKTKFELKKNYKVGEYIYERKIKNIIENTVSIYVDGVKKQDGFDIDYANGSVEFDSAVAIGNEVCADFEFNVRVRFNNDYLDLKPKSKTKISANKIEFIEVM